MRSPTLVRAMPSCSERPQLAEVFDVLGQRFARLAFGVRAHDVAERAVARQRLHISLSRARSSSSSMRTDTPIILACGSSTR